jgi:hypothetical protein
MMDDLDRILSTDDGIEPSSGFANAVMSQVHRVAAEPPPLPFPWGRFVAGVAACGVLAWTGTSLAIQAGPSLSPIVGPAAQLVELSPQLVFAAIPLLVVFAIARLPRFLVQHWS